MVALALTLAATSRGLAALAVERPSFSELVGACATLVPDATTANLASLAVLSVATTALLLAVRRLVAVVVANRAARAVCDGAARRSIAGEQVVVLPDSVPRAFCVGLLRPAIVVSSGTIGQLAEREIEAVVAHEAAHVRRRDPLRIAALAILADALFFLPVIRRLADRHATLAEIGADEAAAARAGRPALARALLVFTDPAAPASSVGIDTQRLDALLGQPTRFVLSTGLLLGSFTTLLTLATLAATSAPVSDRAGETARTCILVFLAIPIIGAIVTFARPRRSRSEPPRVR